MLKKKAYKAQETSHLSSDSDNETSKRQKKLPLRFQSSSSDDENHSTHQKSSM